MYSYKFKVIILIFKVISTAKSVEITDLTPLRVPTKNIYVSYASGDGSDVASNFETDKEPLLQSVDQFKPNKGSSRDETIEINSDLESSGEFPDPIPPQIDLERSSSESNPDTIIENSFRKNEKLEFLEQTSIGNINSPTNSVFRTNSCFSDCHLLCLLVGILYKILPEMLYVV